MALYNSILIFKSSIFFQFVKNNYFENTICQKYKNNKVNLDICNLSDEVIMKLSKYFEK